MSAAPIVHIVDDDAATRDAMRALFNSVALNNHCYASAEAFLEAFDELDSQSAGCILLDLRMPGMSGLELQNALRDRRSTLPIIFLTGHGKVSAAVRAMHGGAVDFLTKPVDDEALLEKVQDAIRHDQATLQTRHNRERYQALMASLTPREHEVLKAVTRGLSNKQMARELDISPKTVELHRAHMMEKMQAHSIAEVVQMHLLAVGIDEGGPGEEE